MLPSRKIITAFVGVFILGTLTGGLATWDFTGRKLTRFISNTNDPKGMALRINQKYLASYNLTSEQQAKIEPLVEEMAHRLHEERQQFGLDAINTLDEYHAKIAAFMTPEQRALYEKANAERREWMTKALLLDESTGEK